MDEIQLALKEIYDKAKLAAADKWISVAELYGILETAAKGLSKAAAAVAEWSDPAKNATKKAWVLAELKSLFNQYVIPSLPWVVRAFLMTQYGSQLLDTTLSLLVEYAYQVLVKPELAA